MPKLNELQDRPDGIVLPNQLIAIADPATGEMYRLPLSIVLGITDITQPDAAAQILRFWKGPDDYFDIDFTGASPGGGGGGAASRFGYPGEDITSDVGRTIDMQGSPFIFLNSSLFASGSFTKIGAESATGSAAEILSTGVLSLSNNTGYGASIDVNNVTFSRGLHLPDADGTFAVSVNNSFADAAGNITISKGEFTDNGAAIAAGLTPGDIYRTGDLLKIVH